MASMPDVLSDDAVAVALATVSGWSGDHRAIRRTVECPSFPAAIAFVDRIAVAAEAADHHPDIDVRWRTVHLVLSTHSAGGVTRKDLDLAAEIDALAPDTA